MFITFRNTEASGTHQSVSFQFASWLMVITDDFENSSKSLFPYDQYEMPKSIYAIAAITLN